MPNIIFTSRYLKSSSSKKASNLVKYVGSRDGVELNKTDIDPNTPATKKQEKLIMQLQRDFPKLTELLEYEDYKNNATVENASELIDTVLEQYADLTANKENFVKYMGMRPRVEKAGAHGLFTQDNDSFSLNAAAEEVSKHEGNVWSHVLSLRREDSERLGFNNQESFKLMIQKYSPNIAKAHKIPIKNLKWYAAFHNESHHPHIHLIVYSDDVNKGYLTNEGIEEMRSTFTNHIFKNELMFMYDEQTDVRNKLRNEAKAKAEMLVSEIESGACENQQIETLIVKLHRQLENVSGKKVYGYLPKEVKETVDNIVKELASDERIAEIYNEWYKCEFEKYKNYTDKIPDNVPLEKQKEFKSIKNSVIKAACSLNVTLPDMEFEKAESIEELPDPEPEEISFWEMSGFKEYNSGKAYISGEYVQQDVEAGIKLLKASSELGFDRAAYYLGKTYQKGEYVQQDIHEAIKWFKKAAESNNQFAEFKLGKIYSSGEYLKKDLKIAENWFKAAAEQDNHFAQYALSRLYLDEELYNPQEAISLLDKSAKRNNQYALLKLGRLLLEDSILEKDVALAINMLERSANHENSYAEYALGKLYLYGKDIERDVGVALHYLHLSAEHNNVYAQQLLDKCNDNRIVSTIGTTFSLFSHLAGMFHSKMKLPRNNSSMESKQFSKLSQKKKALGQKDSPTMKM